MSRLPKPYLTTDEAVEYLRSLGLTATTASTIKTHAYKTGKLAKPRISGRQAFWSRKSLDQLVEAL
ncbi:DNA-binding protein [Mycolicibacterium llatzerense]|uniref:DNA-binding protein n=1 Tax=Mycolicibacterium llatzerense TaxID=280871 RepID=UPI0021B6054D|nr:DNA-binding protein [Mycolicibacterium llatzerense]MCT7365931.1 hypothetical protein [Mycolicibacterium llatzerense]